MINRKGEGKLKLSPIFFELIIIYTKRGAIQFLTRNYDKLKKSKKTLLYSLIYLKLILDSLYRLTSAIFPTGLAFFK